MLGLGSNITKAGKIGKPIVKDGLVLKHGYAGGPVQPISTGAASFNGTSDYIAINAKPVDTADATYCFWANSSQTGENRGVFGHGDGSIGGFDINHEGTNKPLLYLNSGHYQYWDDNPAQDDGRWHHWAVVVDISSIAGSKLYIDGVLQNQGSGAEGTADAYGNMEIGRSSTNYEYEGYICNFGVWDVHLTQPQVKSIMHKDYAALSASEKTNLVSWWNLDSVIDSVGAATTVYDNHYAGGSKLGTELVNDGSFANGLDSWTSANVTLSGSSVILYDDSSDYVFQNISYDDGEVYAFTFEGTGDIRTRVGHSGAAATQIDVTLPATIYRLVDSDANRVQVYGSSDDSAATLTSVSVKLVNGNTGTLA